MSAAIELSDSSRGSSAREVNVTRESRLPLVSRESEASQRVMTASSFSLQEARERRGGSFVSETRTPPSAFSEFLTEWGFWIFFWLGCLGCAGTLVALYIADYGERENKDDWLTKEWKHFLKLMSIPIVGVLFTWAHIVLAVKMMFHPLKFIGCCQFGNSGYGLGWQGIVPRKAGVMAEKSCDLMVGRLIKMEEIMDRFNVDELFGTLGSVLLECQRAANEKLGSRHFPLVWHKLPDSVKEELLRKIMEVQQETFNPIMAELRKNITTIFNVKDMCVKRYTDNPELLIAMFQQVGRKEFSFIGRCGGEMGLALGLLQLALFNITDTPENWWVMWWLLPVSGLVVGWLSNYVAIKMIFWPTYPHQYCGGMLNVQGLFLKRQQEVAKELAKLLTETCVNADQMVRYLVSSPGYQQALEIFHKHTSQACDDILGSMRHLAPLALGGDEFASLKRGAVEALLEELPNHGDQFLKFVDQVLQIEDTIAYRLAKLPPDEFEGMLHPAFQEDEWMLILLGAVLGVIIGFIQASTLGA